ncbi:MAG: thioredoxin-like domain-containing protein [Chitinophagales bacterium]
MIKKTIPLLLLFGFVYFVSCDAQTNKPNVKINEAPPEPLDHYKIDVKITDLPNQELYLAYHFGNKQYMKDTVMLDENGTGTFEGDEALDGGIYLIVFPSKKYFEFVVNNENFSIETDTSNPMESLKIEGSLENELYLKDMAFIRKMQQKKKTLQNQQNKEGIKEKEKKEIKAELERLDEEVKAFREELITQNNGFFYPKFLKALEDPEIPEEVKNNTADSNASFYYYRNHYFENMDFSDDRLLRTPSMHNKVVYYIDKLTPQSPDSLNKAVDVVLQRAKKNDDVFQYFTVFLLNKFAKSKVMGFDNVYVHLVENYYASGDAWWVDSTDLYRITSRAKELKPTLVGQKAPTLVLKNENDKIVAINNLPNKYTLLYFYDPDCGHCKKETPKMVKAVNEAKEKNIDIQPVAVSIDSDEEKWHKFMKEYGVDTWINLADLNYRNNFREIYDLQSTPRAFLLDSDKKIIAKRFDSNQLINILNQHEKIEQKKAGK